MICPKWPAAAASKGTAMLSWAGDAFQVRKIKRNVRFRI
ncbi:hypothetical protein D3OALGA1CA_5454 [Olavius algarvensis associated proteobacterium Delta 3]|nr:hypothetical protein D3OALGB2SA_3745 [Olavius algarvensis associated proteobacterium Delta 3]CAB5167142.1 hypothetical protein D3OALGA1CA_5454 [Olavius algarvensis associated proteobacterium Delta 3]